MGQWEDDRQNDLHSREAGERCFAMKLMVTFTA